MRHRLVSEKSRQQADVLGMICARKNETKILSVMGTQM